MRPKLTDAQGRPIFELSNWTLTARPADDVVVIQLHYQIYAGAPKEGTGQTPLVSLSPQQLAHLAGALQQKLLELKQGGAK